MNKQELREQFEGWLIEVHMLTGTWNESRNCYDEYPCHLAHQAYQAAWQACEAQYVLRYYD